MESATNEKGSTILRGSRQTRRRKSSNAVSKRHSAPPVRPAIVFEPRVIPQRVFLYLQLNNIVNLPVVSYPLELHLYHVKNTLQKMSEHYTTETIIFENEFEAKRPAFAMGIIQDSIEDMNIFSDNPLVVSLYQRIPRHRRCDLKTVMGVRTQASSGTMKVGRAYRKHQVKSPSVKDAGDGMDEQQHAQIVDMSKETFVDASVDVEVEFGEGEDDDYVEESLEFLSRGHCDLLQLFQCKRFINNIPIMLYAEYDRMLETETSQKITTTSEWHMYSILPILKNFHFTNLAFFTLESIYNAPEELHQRAGHLGISLSIRPTIPDLHDEHQVYPLCTFYGFISQIIAQQNIVIVWESIKRDLLRESRSSISCNQMQTSLSIKLPRIFRELLRTPNVDLKINHIEQIADLALINNSMHRYVLTAEMREILEAAVVHNQYELLLQLYDEVPANVLYEGTINPSVFGYPNVNSCRFASVLSPVMRRTRKTFRMSEVPEPHSPMFVIMKICFFQTLTTRNESLDVYNENHMKTAKLRRCLDLNLLKDDVNSSDVVRELYRNFDELIKELISFTVKNDVINIDDKRHTFCCHLANLRNLLVDICGSDFNVRMPTKSNIEFREMLTHMHKELMERVEELLTACSWQSPSTCVIHYTNEQLRTQHLMQEYRNMCNNGECVMAKQMFAELKTDCSNRLLFNFYVFLTAVENRNYEQASVYLLTQRETNWTGDYFVSLMELYVNYQLLLKIEEKEGEAYCNMLEQLRIFSNQNRLDRDVWILLYCYYKQHNYLPGMEYTRWQYENLYDVPGKALPLLPRTLYESFIPVDFELSGMILNGNRFYDVFKTFAQLGAYGFAEIIFAEIASEFTITESYLIITTLKMLQGEIDNNFQIKKLATDNSARGKLMRFYQAHINGNVEYTRQRYNEAIKHYKDLLSINLTDDSLLSMFHTSLMRLGRLCFENDDYEMAKQAYEMCIPFDKKEKNYSANYGLGLSMYYLNRLEDAIEYLARSTDNDIFMPNPWGYLAVINLRLGRNKSALDCWKVAKMYPEMPLSNRIYDELEKIKYSDICLLVEDDCKPEMV